MGEKKSSDDRPFVWHEVGHDGLRLLHAFSQSSVIGFAILDDHLRYEAINHCLAAIHGVSGEAHLGHTVVEILGDVGPQAASQCQRVLATGEALQFEITNTAQPTKPQSTYWRLKSCFVIQQCAVSRSELGMVAVDVTKQKRLETLFCEPAANLYDARSEFWLARELHESVEQYHLALELSLALLICERKRNIERLARSVAALDGRIMAMNALVSTVARSFSIDK